jgi:hypothetical protein
MSGIPEYNFPAFNAAAKALRLAGFFVINPADFGCDESVSWRKCLERDLMAMFHADIVATLPGFEKSKGATLENYVANALGTPVTTVSELLRDAANRTATYDQSDPN